MQWQDQLKGETGSGPETAREAVKQFLHGYVVLEWTPEQIPTRVSGYGWDAHIGGEASDEQGQPHQLQRYQIAVTRFQNAPCFVVFELTELIAEIRREVGLWEPPAESQQDQEHRSQEVQEDAHEAVKDILRLYLNWPLAEIIAVDGPATTGDWRIQMGGEVLERGEPRS